MLRRTNYDLIPSSEITSESVYHERRALMKLGASAAILGMTPLMAAFGIREIQKCVRTDIV